MSHIESISRYEAAIERNIRNNRRIGSQRRWLAGTPDAKTITNFLFEIDEFGRVCKCCNVLWEDHVTVNDYVVSGPTDKCSPVTNPVVKASGKLHAAMREALNEWGGLTEKQNDLVRSMIEKGAERVAEREKFIAEKHAADLTKTHVGTVGARIDLTLTVEKVLEFDGRYGTTFINLCRDENGNVVVYKGSNTLQPLNPAFTSHEDTTQELYLPLPQVVRVKATVKAHDVRDGVPQTIISRPKVI
ncbi:MAG: hypothetical protein ACR2IJ_04835 [Fluviibacter sp.]